MSEYFFYLLAILAIMLFWFSILTEFRIGLIIFGIIFSIVLIWVIIEELK